MSIKSFFKLQKYTYTVWHNLRTADLSYIKWLPLDLNFAPGCNLITQTWAALQIVEHWSTNNGLTEISNLDFSK